MIGCFEFEVELVKRVKYQLRANSYEEAERKALKFDEKNCWDEEVYDEIIIERKSY